MNNKFSYHLVSLLLIILLNSSIIYSHYLPSQEDTVLAPDIPVLPVIDGMGDDDCWQEVSWQTIDNVWIPYDGSVTQNDYNGHYKIVWSSSANLLYILIEVNDDVFIDGFVFGQTADVYNFDITEVFIDEDNSGGEHIFDGGGTNAENAFTYHIYSDFPVDGNVNINNHYVGDLDGTNWGNVQNPNYASHLPEFALRKSGSTATWEFSLIVYNSTYENNNVDPARVQLAFSKVMGLSVAYCDNDNDDGNRDNMFGSVWEPSPGNLHWQNADYFGNVKLVEGVVSVEEEKSSTGFTGIKFYPNPAVSSSQLLMDNSYRGDVQIKVYNVLGQEVFQTSVYKANQQFTHTLNLKYLSSGIYFIQAQMGKDVFSEKFIVTNK